MGSNTQDVSINNNRMMFQTHSCKEFLGFAPEVSQYLKLLSAVSAAIPEEGAIASLLLYRGICSSHSPATTKKQFYQRKKHLC